MYSLFDIYKHCVLDLRMDAQNPKDFSGNGKDGVSVQMDNTNIVVGTRRGDFGLLGNGTNERVDVGNIGTIYSLVLYVKPITTTEELAILAAGKTITLSSGTLTFTGFSPTGYVNGEQSTAVLANKFQLLGFSLAAGIDANDLELFWNGSGYGNLVVSRVLAFNSVLQPIQHKFLYEALRIGQF